jgi:cyclohexanone monooxygenase
MEEIRARVDAIVENSETAEALKAWYGLLCKRPTFHDGYLQTFNRPNVTLVDTRGRGVERITPDGVVANGREYPLDCIIFATGFDTTSGLIKGIGFEPVGRDGVTLTQRWTRDFSTLHGVMISEFPNMFLIGGVQGTQATTVTYGYSVQAEHCAQIVAHCRSKAAKRVEASPEAEQRWKAELAEKSLPHHDYYDACTPGYINFEGKGGFVWDYFYGAGPVAYREVLDRWREQDLPRDLTLD